MKLTLKNFRCYTEQEFDFGENGMLLLSGPSGQGKSTILLAINFVLYGTGSKLVTYGKTSCRVELEIDDMVIVRTKRPNRLIINDTHEDASAQSIIDKKFGKTFDVTGYICQNASNSFVMMSPMDKLAFLERFAFSDIDLSQLKAKCKALIKKRNEELIVTTSQLEMVTNVLNDMIEPEKVEYPLKKTKNKETAMKNQEIRLKNTEKLIQRAQKTITKLTAELNALKVLDAKTTTKTNSLNNIVEKIEDMEFEKQTLEYKGDSVLQEYEEKLNLVVSQRELQILEDRYDEDEQRIQSMIETETHEIQDKINKITTNLWKEYTQKQVGETLISYKQLYKDMKELENMREKLVQYEVNEVHYEEDKNNLQKITRGLEEQKTLLAKLKLQQELYICPSCDQTLRIQDGDLYVADEIDVEEEDISNVEKRVGSLQSKVHNLERKISNDRNKLDRYRELTIKIDGIVSQYEDDELPSSTDVENDMEYLRDYKRSQLALESEKKDLEKMIKDEKYSSNITNFQDSLKKQKKRIKSLKALKKSQANINMNEDELRVFIQTQKRTKDRLDDINKRLRVLMQEKSTYQSQIVHDKEEHISVYKIIRNPSIVQDLINAENDKLNSLRTEREIYKTNVEKIIMYKKYLDDSKYYQEWVDKVSAYKKKEDIDRRKYAASTLLKEKILEAESIAMVNVINSINSHVQNYLDLFFTADPISARLLPYKESKKDRKPQINIQIEYKGMEADLTMLSGGELSRVILAFTLGLGEIFNTPLLLLDECTASLDQELTTQVIDGIRENYTDKMVIIIAHQVVSGHFDRVINL